MNKKQRAEVVLNNHLNSLQLDLKKCTATEKALYYRSLDAMVEFNRVENVKLAGILKWLVNTLTLNVKLEHEKLQAYKKLQAIITDME